MKFSFLMREILAGNSVTRAYMNLRLMKEVLEGDILDLGSGGGDSYSKRIPQTADAQYFLFDVKKGKKINFEVDQFSYENNTYDRILLLNVLEHIYNHKHLLAEIKRIKKNEGLLIGFVPFLMWYHADPHDYFRYTHEALEKILEEVGYQEIEIENIYFGPYTTAFQMIYPTVPRVLRPIVFAGAYMLDIFFRSLRKEGAQRYTLGYYFKVR